MIAVTLSVQLVSAWRSTSWIEILAAALAVAYLLLAIRQSLGCWARGVREFLPVRVGAVRGAPVHGVAY